MSKLTEIVAKIRRKWTKIRLQPIRVFCFHHVSDAYDASYMWEEDWTNTDVLKNFIGKMQQYGYTFISLQKAYEKLKRDRFRCKKYAVLTADDGFKSLLNILPWLEEKRIPITLFINPKYILEDSIGINTQNRIEQTQSKLSSDEIYLKLRDKQAIQSPYVSFGYHGFEHLDEWRIDKETFIQNVEQCMDSIHGRFPNVVPYYAHTYGHAQKRNDAILLSKGITPIYTSGAVNYTDTEYIDRELISNERILKWEVHV